MYTQLVLADGTELDVVREVEVSAVKCCVVIGTATFESLSEIMSSLTKTNLATVEYKTLPEDNSEPKTIRTYTDMTVEPYSFERKAQYIELSVTLRKITDDERRDEKLIQLINSLSDEDAVLFKPMYPTFDELSSKDVSAGDKFTFKGALYKSNKDLVAGTLSEAMAMIDETGSNEEYFTCIDKARLGTYDDPIIYDRTVQLQENRFYKQDGVVYYCIQSPKRVIDHDLFDVLDLYVKEPDDIDINPLYPVGPLYQYSRDTLPWPENVNTLYDGKIWISKRATEDVPSLDNSDDWRLYCVAKPGEKADPIDPNLFIDNTLPTEGQPVVDGEPVKEPDTQEPGITDPANKDTTDSTGKDSTDESGAGSGSTDATTPGKDTETNTDGSTDVITPDKDKETNIDGGAGETTPGKDSTDESGAGSGNTDGSTDAATPGKDTETNTDVTTHDKNTETSTDESASETTTPGTEETTDTVVTPSESTEETGSTETTEKDTAGDL